jgi:hypothetical protein
MAYDNGGDAIRPAEDCPDVIVALLRFDHVIGPVLAWSTLDDDLDRTSSVLRTALTETLPMFALPEGASSRRSNVEAKRSKGPKAFHLEIKHESRFILPVGTNSEVLFGCAAFAVFEHDKAISAESAASALKSPTSPWAERRGASQFAVALLMKAPAMDFLLDRLRSVVSVFVRAQCRDGRGLGDRIAPQGAEVLRALRASIDSKQVHH